MKICSRGSIARVPFVHGSAGCVEGYEHLAGSFKDRRLSSVGMGISAYIPCFNNADTICVAVESIRAQTVAVDEIFVVDDASSDGSCEILRSLGIRVVALNSNLGRGAVRARAMEEASHEFVLSCDATNQLPADFLQSAMHWFEAVDVAAVYGRMAQKESHGVVDRWRARHLFKADVEFTARHHVSLITYGLVMRRSSVLAVGNFDQSLRHTEDVDLGVRLLAQGRDVVFDPALKVYATRSNSLSGVLERYWRWYAGKDEEVTWRGYLRQIVYSVKVMAYEDWKAQDKVSILISLLSPHYQFWRSWLRGARRRA